MAGTVAHARRALEMAGPHRPSRPRGRCGVPRPGRVGRRRPGRGRRHLRAGGPQPARPPARSQTRSARRSCWAACGSPAAALTTARRLYEEALATAQRHPGPPLSTTGDLHVGLADVLREMGRARRGRRAPPGGEGPRGPGVAAGEPAPLVHRDGRAPAGPGRPRRRGRPCSHAAEPLFRPGFFPDVRPLPAARARVRIAQGRLPDAWVWAEQCGVTVADPPSFLTEYDQLTLARLHLAEQRAGSDRAAVGDVLRAARPDPRRRGAGDRGGSLVEAHLVRALAHQPAATSRQRCRTWAAALGRGVPAGYQRLFLDEGQPMHRPAPAPRRAPARQPQRLARAPLRAGARPNRR